MKIKTRGIGIGGVTMVSIFVILTLGMFAALAVSTTGANLRLSQKYATNTVAYYAADAKAQAQLFAAAEGSAPVANPFEVEIDSYRKLVVAWHLDEKLGLVVDSYRSALTDALEYGTSLPEIWDGGLPS